MPKIELEDAIIVASANNIGQILRNKELLFT
jgi:hypothetical protein